MDAAESRAEACRELCETVRRMGYPEQFGRDIAKNLGSEKMIRRMISYLHQASPRSAEEIADEMLAIMSDREAWVKKKQAQEANAAYNEMMLRGFPQGKD